MAQSPALARTISRSRKNDCKGVRSKPKCQGRIEVADAFPRRRLLEEIPREKMKASSGARKMGREGVQGEADAVTLEEGDLVSSIAEQVGYESTPAFSRVFKREFGMSPGQYRRSSTIGERTSEAETHEAIASNSRAGARELHQAKAMSSPAS